MCLGGSAVRALGCRTQGRGSNLSGGSGIGTLTGCRIPVDSALNEYLSQIRVKRKRTLPPMYKGL